LKAGHIFKAREERPGELFLLWRVPSFERRNAIGLLGILNYRNPIYSAPMVNFAMRPWTGFGLRLRAGPVTLLLALFSFAAFPQAAPLARAHAHNDYLHRRPLLDALGHGFTSVEADIYLIDGHLLVAHDQDKAWATNTLQALYLDPLLARAKLNKGRIYPEGPVFTLLIDVKSEAEATYSVLKEVLKPYQKMLTRFSNDSIETNAVTIVLSGNRAQAAVAAEKIRFVSIDGRLPDLDTKVSRCLMPLVSDNWVKHFQWRGVGPLPEEDKRKLDKIVTAAHEQGQKLRFWGTPDSAQVWQQLYDAGVDFLNTDDLPGMESFLRSRK
jgi:hypothetical protein